MDVSRETQALLEAFAEMLVAENARQNLIAKSTVGTLWKRHIADSAQLVRFRESPGRWMDIGSGAGLPGLVIAIVTGDPVTLVEPRELRVQFLERVKHTLALGQVEVFKGKAERARGRFDYITARAVASADALLAMTRHLAHDGTRWLLPKGRSAQSELEAVKASWQGEFRLERSVTDDEAWILVAEGVRAKGKP